MTPKELTEKTIKDIRERRRKAEREFYCLAFYYYLIGMKI